MSADAFVGAVADIHRLLRRDPFVCLLTKVRAYKREQRVITLNNRATFLIQNFKKPTCLRRLEEREYKI